MSILFIHQNFPGQFKFRAPALAQQDRTVVAMGEVYPEFQAMYQKLVIERAKHSA